MLNAMDPTRQRVAAEAADRSTNHRCMECGEAVVLKRGRVVIPHFAHHAASACAWAHGETRQHLAAKNGIANAFRARGLIASIEAKVLSCAGDRRADILVQHPSNGALIAIEIQHSALELEAIQMRTRAYSAAAVAVIWVPTLDRVKLALRSMGDRLFVSERYPVPPWQRFAAAYHEVLWFWMDGSLWRGWLDQAWVPVRARGTVDSEDWTRSLRWAGLTLEGPFPPAALRIQTYTMSARQHEQFILSAGPTARFVVNGQRGPTAAPTTLGWAERDGRCFPLIMKS